MEKENLKGFNKISKGTPAIDKKVNSMMDKLDCKLRIGNLITIKPKYGDAIQHTVKASTFSEMEVKQGREYLGIELTEDWLNKNCEFSQEGWFWIVWQGIINDFLVSFNILKHGTGRLDFTMEVNGSPVFNFGEIEHLHTLQNKIHSLTGSELKISPTAGNEDISVTVKYV